MDYKYIIDQWDDVIFIGTVEECLAELDRNPEAVAIRDTRYRKSAIEKMEMIIKSRKVKSMASVSRNVNIIRVGAGNIKAWAEQIVETINDFDGYDSLQTAEILMERIKREAVETGENIMEAYYELEED